MSGPSLHKPRQDQASSSESAQAPARPGELWRDCASPGDWEIASYRDGISRALRFRSWVTPTLPRYRLLTNWARLPACLLVLLCLGSPVLSYSSGEILWLVGCSAPRGSIHSFDIIFSVNFIFNKALNFRKCVFCIVLFVLALRVYIQNVRSWIFSQFFISSILSFIIWVQKRSVLSLTFIPLLWFPTILTVIFAILVNHIELKKLTENTDLQSHTMPIAEEHNMSIGRKLLKNWRCESAA